MRPERASARGMKRRGMGLFEELRVGALGEGGRRALGGGWGASSFHPALRANERRRLKTNMIRLSASRIEPAIMLSSASVAVFGSVTVLGAGWTTGRLSEASCA